MENAKSSWKIILWNTMELKQRYYVSTLHLYVGSLTCLNNIFSFIFFFDL